jgi:hypothetical protein
MSIQAIVDFCVRLVGRPLLPFHHPSAATLQLGFV